jgi:hypothetical protein
LGRAGGVVECGCREVFLIHQKIIEGVKIFEGVEVFEMVEFGDVDAE